MSESLKNQSVKFKVGLVFVAVVLVVLLIFVLCSIKTIQPGYAGIVYNMNGGLETTTMSQGVHFVAPWKQVTSYPISTESVYFSKDNKEGGDSDQSVNPITADSKTVSMDVAYTYHYDLQGLPKVFAKFRGQSAEVIADGYIRQFMKDSINAVTSQYGIFEVCGSKQAEISTKIYTDFAGKLKPDGIVIESFSITAVRTDDETKKGIQAKIDADQALATAKVKLEQAQVDAQTAITKAEGEAKANQILEASINQNLINYNKWNKWNGQLPNTVAGSNTDILVDGSGTK